MGTNIIFTINPPFDLNISSVPETELFRVKRDAFLSAPRFDLSHEPEPELTAVFLCIAGCYIG